MRGDNPGELEHLLGDVLTSKDEQVARFALATICSEVV